MTWLITNTLLHVAVALLTARTCGESDVVPSVPITARLPITDEYHGVRIIDNYRWLERQDSADVKKWSDAQNARTQAYLDNLPVRRELLGQLRRLSQVTTPTYDTLGYAAGTLVAEKSDASSQQPYLVSLSSTFDNRSERVILDPNLIDAQGSTSIDFFKLSLDGRFIAVSMSQNGTESGTARVIEVGTGRELPDRVVGTNSPTAAGSIVWKRDNSGFYYTRFAQGNPSRQQVYFHKLGTDCARDLYVIGKEFPAIAEIRLASDRSGRWILASVAMGDGGAVCHYLMNDAGNWTQVSRV